MKTVFIVPTGIGAEIGGHAGDASPAANLIAAVSDVMVTHPNVYNASDINEMAANALYVEGSMLDRFLEGKIGLSLVRSNRVLVVTNSPLQPETANSVSAARATIGMDTFIVELNIPLRMVAAMKDGIATGDVYGWEELCSQVSQYSFDALAIVTPIEVDEDVVEHYLLHGGVNPWGGVEAVASKLIADRLSTVPVAHAPVESGTLASFNEIVDPRMSAEMVSMSFLHCVMKGLHKAPRVSATLEQADLLGRDIDCLITPAGCWGRPHEACRINGIPIIAVLENKTKLNNIVVPAEDNIYLVANYFEAAGLVAAMGAGLHPPSIRRPLEPTKVIQRQHYDQAQG